MPSALILAAGVGRRFGADKRLHALVDDSPLIVKTLSRYAAVFEDLWVVLNQSGDPAAHLVQKEFPNAQLVCANDAHLGMGHSLSEGVAGLRTASTGGVVIGLADMPFVSKATLQAVSTRVDAYAPETARIVQPVYQDQRRDKPGHPVGFTTALLPALENCAGDQGARGLIRDAQRRGYWEPIPVTDIGVIRDVDRPADLAD